MFGVLFRRLLSMNKSCRKIKWSKEKKENFSGIDIKADFILFKSDYNEYGASGFRAKQQGR